MNFPHLHVQLPGVDTCGHFAERYIRQELNLHGLTRLSLVYHAEHPVAEITTTGGQNFNSGAQTFVWSISITLNVAPGIFSQIYQGAFAHRNLKLSTQRRFALQQLLSSLPRHTEISMERSETDYKSDEYQRRYTDDE